MSRPQPSLSWFRRPKRAWRALHAVERLGWILLLGYLPLHFVHQEMRDRESAAWTQAIRAGLPPPASSPIIRPLGWTAASLQVGGLLLIWRGRVRYNTHLRRHGFALCPGCGYDLSAPRRAAHCPECGRAFGPKGFIREWARILPRNGRGPGSGDPYRIQRHPEDAR